MMSNTLTNNTKTSNELGSVNLRILGNATFPEIRALFDSGEYAPSVLAADAAMAESFECQECRTQLIYVGARKTGGSVKSFMVCPVCDRAMEI